MARWLPNYNDLTTARKEKGFITRHELCDVLGIKFCQFKKLKEAGLFPAPTNKCYGFAMKLYSTNDIAGLKRVLEQIENEEL